jgi:uncharacterized protein YggU (UPF0235/DUF167 family)
MDKNIVDFLKQKNSFEINVKTNQRVNDLKLLNDALIVNIKSKPENNKANDEIEKFISKISGKTAKIIKGKTSKKKIIKFC